MTVPWGGYPAGTLGSDLSSLNGLDEATWKANLRNEKLSGFDAAHAIYSGKRQQYTSQLADMNDGQLSLNDRTDLLKRVSGYGCAVMGHNWIIPQNSAVIAPFDQQVGPSKRTAIDAADMYHGRLCLKSGGLWRFDAMMSLEYRAYTRTSRIQLGMIVYSEVERAVTPVYRVEIVDASGALFAAKEFQGTSTNFGWARSGLPTQSVAPIRYHSSAWSTTAVLPEMPLPDDHPQAPDQWMYARVSMKWVGISGLTNDSYAKFIGGTKKSGLYASRWSLDADHINYADTVPDGGTLS